MKEPDEAPVSTWEIVRKCSPYNHNKIYDLRLTEKLNIATYVGNNQLSKTKRRYFKETLYYNIASL